jgi:hypothetical protein
VAKYKPNWLTTLEDAGPNAAARTKAKRSAEARTGKPADPSVEEATCFGAVQA